MNTMISFIKGTRVRVKCRPPCPVPYGTEGEVIEFREAHGTWSGQKENPLFSEVIFKSDDGRTHCCAATCVETIMKIKTTISPASDCIMLRSLASGDFFRWGNRNDAAHQHILLLLNANDAKEYYILNITTGKRFWASLDAVGTVQPLALTRVDAEVTR